MYNKNIDMTDFSPYSITQVFSCMYLNNPFVWEFLEDESIQVYTMSHPKQLQEGSEDIEWDEDIEIRFVIEDWTVWKSIEVYTKNIKSGTNEFENIINYESFRIKRGLI